MPRPLLACFTVARQLNFKMFLPHPVTSAPNYQHSVIFIRYLRLLSEDVASIYRYAKIVVTCGCSQQRFPSMEMFFIAVSYPDLLPPCRDAYDNWPLFSRRECVR